MDAISRLAFGLMIAGLAIPTNSPPARSQGTSREFPIVVGDKSLLADIGIIITSFGKPDPNLKHTSNKCYHNPDLVHEASVTDELLAAQQARGFSLNSLCLTLWSGVRFDPESGKRVPTMVVADLDRIGQPDGPGDVVSPEIVLSPPRCFANGTPYQDCKSRYSISSGTPLSANLQALSRQRAATIDRLVDEILPTLPADRCAETPNPCADPALAGWLLPSGQLSDRARELDLGNVAFFDVSADLPRGYGYALQTPFGGGPPSPSTEVYRAVTERRRDLTPARVKAYRPKVMAER